MPVNLDLQFSQKLSNHGHDAITSAASLLPHGTDIILLLPSVDNCWLEHTIFYHAPYFIYDFSVVDLVLL